MEWHIQIEVSKRMIFGKVEVEEKLYSFSFDTDTFRLTIHDIPGLVFTDDGHQAEETFTFMSCVDGKSSNNKYPYMRFIVKGQISRGISQISMDILYYIETYEP